MFLHTPTLRKVENNDGKRLNIVMDKAASDLDQDSSMSTRPRWGRRFLLVGGAWVFAGKLVTGTAQILIAMLLARLLTSEEFGIFQVLQRIMQFMAIAGSFGMGWVVIRRLAEGMRRDDKAWGYRQARSVFVIVAILSVGLAALLGIAGHDLLELSLRVNVQDYLYVMVALVVMVSYQQVVPEAYRGLHDLKLASLYSGAATNLAMLFVFALFWLSGSTLDISAALWVYLLCSLLVLMLSGLTLKRRLTELFERTDHLLFREDIMENLKTGLPLTLSSVLSFITKQADVWIVAARFDVMQAAYYGAASRLVCLIAAPVMVANGATRGVIADLWASGDKMRLERLLRTVALLTFLSGMIPGLIFMLWNEPLMATLFGEEYRAGAAVLSILILGQLALLAAGPAGTLMSLSGHERGVLRYDAMGTALFIVAAVIFSRGFGMEGVAVAAVMAGIFRPVMCMWFVWNKLGIRSYFAGPLMLMGRR